MNSHFNLTFFGFKSRTNTESFDMVITLNMNVTKSLTVQQLLLLARIYSCFELKSNKNIQYMYIIILAVHLQAHVHLQWRISVHLVMHSM